MRRKIFGIGLSKTGTSSLGAALTILGHKTVHNPTDDETMSALLEGNVRCDAIREHDALCDIMFSRHFRELDRAYPGSLFILTERDRKGWHASCERHWAARKVDRNSLWNEHLVDFQVYGTALYQPSLFEDAYAAHYGAVRAYFKDRPHQLLSMNICSGEGWDRLCHTLGVRAPAIAFPHVRPQPWMPPSPKGTV